MGQARTTQFNDALYLFTDATGAPITPVASVDDFYRMTIGSGTLTNNDTAWDSKNFIVYDIDAAEEVLSRPYVPAYRADHTYSFIIDTSLLPLDVTIPSLLHFGVSDGRRGNPMHLTTIRALSIFRSPS